MVKVEKTDRKMLFIRTLFIFFIYLFYNQIGISVAKSLNVDSLYMFRFILDIVFLIFLTSVYRNEIKRDYNRLRYRFLSLEVGGKILFWVITAIILNIVLSLVIGVFSPEYGNSIYNNIGISFDNTWIYTFFKALVFSVIAEQIVFRKMLRDLIDNKFIFVICSSILYALINVVFFDINTKYLFYDFISYLVPAFIFSVAYVRNKDNMMINMLITLCYNLIPTVFLLVSLI